MSDGAQTLTGWRNETPWMPGLVLTDRPALAILVAAYAFSAAVMFGVTQIHVDIGRDFLVPDLMLQGRVLYRDIEYWFGPFAPSLHYLLFRAFGVSTEVIFAAGAAAGLAITLLSYSLARQILPPLEALISGLIVLTHGVFGGSIMNFATPYTYSATYGLLFALLTFWAVTRYLRAAESRWGALAGAAAALALLSKQEFALIAATLLAAGVVMAPRMNAMALPRRAAVPVSAFLTVSGAAAAVLFTYVAPASFLANYYPAESIKALRFFYANTQGWGERAPEFLVKTHGHLLLNMGFVLAATMLLALALGIFRGERPRIPLVVAIIAAAAPLVWARGYLWCYPPLLALLVLVFAWRSPRRPNSRTVMFFAAAALVFGWRVLPNFDIRYYAPMYFVPSVIVYVYLLFEIALPFIAARLPGQAWRASMAAALLGPFVVYQFVQNNWRIARESVPIETPRGTVHIPPERKPAAAAEIALIERYTNPGDPILLAPGGVMQYFLTNRQLPSRYLDYTYATLIDGKREDEEVRALAMHPPKLVIISPHENDAYLPEGSRGRFGIAYNRKVYQWIIENYRPLAEHPDALKGFQIMTPKTAN